MRFRSDVERDKYDDDDPTDYFDKVARHPKKALQHSARSRLEISKLEVLDRDLVRSRLTDHLHNLCGRRRQLNRKLIELIGY